MEIFNKDFSDDDSQQAREETVTVTVIGHFAYFVVYCSSFWFVNRVPNNGSEFSSEEVFAIYNNEIFTTPNYLTVTNPGKFLQNAGLYFIKVQEWQR